MTQLPYYSMYPKDFDTDQAVKLMSNRHLGVYLRLLNDSWVNGGIPNDEESLCVLSREPLPEFRKLWPKIAPLWVPSEADPSKLINKRQEKEREEASKKREKNKANGFLGGRPSKTETKPNGFEIETETKPNGSIRASESDSVYVYSSDKGDARGKREKLESPLSPDQVPWFEEFWGLYWRRVAKKPAMVAFGKQIKTAEAWAACRARLESERAAMMSREEEKRPHAATWLNREDFADSVGALAVATGPKGWCEACNSPKSACFCGYTPYGR